jgi:hypothetical protein
MLEDTIENMSSFMKGSIAIGTGSLVGIVIAKLIMIIGT